MITIKGKTAFFDLDSTLIEWRPSEDRKEVEGTECEWRFQTLAVDGETGRLIYKEVKQEDVFIPIQSNIDQLMEHKRRGHKVIVWSAGGAEWAEKAVKMLGIEDYVDLSIDKPLSIYDDKPFEEAFPKIQFIKDEPHVPEANPESKKEYVPTSLTVQNEAQYGNYGETSAMADDSRPSRPAPIFARR
jgi:FMN phosphatase YigB (HAD superfamily)